MFPTEVTDYNTESATTQTALAKYFSKIEENYTRLYQRRAGGVNINFSTWLGHTTTKAQLFALCFNPETKTHDVLIRLGYNRTSQMTADAIASYTNANKLPSNEYNSNPTKEHTDLVVFVHEIKRGTGLIDVAPQIAKELNGLSLALQENSRHKVKVLQQTTDNGIPMLTIMTNNFTAAMQRKIFGLLPSVYPTLFPNREDITQLCENYATGDYNAWIESFKAWAEKYKIMSIDTKRTLRNHYENILSTDRQRYTSEIDQSRRSIDEHCAAIRNYYEGITRNSALLAALNDSIAEVDEFADYIEANKCLELMPSKTAGWLRFSVHAPLEFYDEDVVATNIRNKRSIINDFGEPVSWAFKKIFVDQEYIIHTQAIFEINQKGELKRTNWVDNKTLYNMIPQPHITGYNCWGLNRPYIEKAFAAGDQITALEQAVAAIKNLNFTDSTVLQHFLEKLTQTSVKTIPSIWDVKNEKWLSFADMQKLYYEEQAAQAAQAAQAKKVKPQPQPTPVAETVPIRENLNRVIVPREDINEIIQGDPEALGEALGEALLRAVTIRGDAGDVYQPVEDFDDDDDDDDDDDTF